MAIAHNAAGFQPQIGGASTNTGFNKYNDTGAAGARGFIPEFWSGKFVEAFYNQTVFGEIANTNYQGEISGMGHKVIIQLTPSVTISNYTIGTNLSYERPPAQTVELTIDRAKSFAYQVHDIEQLQAKPAYVKEFADAAAEQMKVAIDADVLQSVYADPAAANVGNAAGVRSGSIALGTTAPTVDGDSLSVRAGGVDPYEVLSRLAVVLDEQNCPESDRWVVVPPLFRLAMQTSGKQANMIQGGDQSLLRNSKIGTVDRFNIYLSNQLKTTTAATKQVTHLMAGHKSALTFASQMTKMETLRNPNDFGDVMRGLNVYGFKTINPKVMTAASVRFVA